MVSWPLTIKRFVALPSPLMVAAFKSLLNGHSFHSEWVTKSISMIPKPNTDDTFWSNYRPISILNLDIKILLLTSNHIIGTLIHKDQTQVYTLQKSGWQYTLSYAPSTRTSNPLHPDMLPLPWHMQLIQLAILVLPRLYPMLLRVQDTFLRWITMLYKIPKEYASYSEFHSDSFLIERGTRQGCPPSFLPSNRTSSPAHLN